MSFIRIARAWLVLLLAVPAGAQAELVVPDSGARSIRALDGTLVYNRVFGRSTVSKARPWMRVVNGRRLRARGIPRGASPVAMGRDHRGRVVLTMVSFDRGRQLWWIYEVGRDRARRLTSLPGRCGGPATVSIWRGRVAYVISCAGRTEQLDSGVSLRHRGTTRRLTSRLSGDKRNWTWRGPLHLRGGLLFADRDETDGDVALYRLMDGGRH